MGRFIVPATALFCSTLMELGGKEEPSVMMFLCAIVSFVVCLATSSDSE